MAFRFHRYHALPRRLRNGQRPWRFILVACAACLAQACERAPAPAMLVAQQQFTDLRAGQELSVPIAAGGRELLVVSVVPFEAVLSADLRVAGGPAPGAHAFEDRRGVPLFLVHDAASGPGSAELSLRVLAATRRARVEVRVLAVADDSRADRKQLSAYRLYQSATRSEQQPSADTWARRRDEFEQAAALFAAVGSEREALWSELLALIVAYHPLSEIPQVLEAAPGLAARARAGGHHDIAVKAKQLSGQAAMYLGGQADAQARGRAMEQALVAFAEAEAWSGVHDLVFQQAWARNNQGIARHYQGDFDAAVLAYDRAAALAAGLDDPFLDAVIRSNRASALEKSGRFDLAAGELADVIGWQRGQGDPMALAFSLKRMADVDLARYRFTEAITAYREAADLAEANADRELAGYSLLALGNAWLELGEPGRALTAVTRAIELLDPASAPAALNQAHAAAAGIHRLQGNAAGASEHRALQRPVTDLERAAFHLERAKDTLLLPPQGGPAPAAHGAATDLQAARSHAAAAGREDWVQLATLYECLHFDAGTGDACGDDALRARFASPALQARPASWIEASVVLSRIWLQHGNAEAALAQLDDVTDRMAEVRDHLRGTEGAWFWQSRAEILDRQLALQVGRDLESGDPAPSLMLLDAFRNRGLGPAGSPAQAGPGTPVPARQRLDALRRQLPQDATVLAWFFSGSGVVRWAITRERAALARLSADASLEQEIRAVSASLRTFGDTTLDQRLEALGAGLLSDLGQDLPARLFVMTGGPLNGFPVDALRLGGEHLAAHHDVAYLQSLDSITTMATLGQAWTPRRLVFAGAPTGDGNELPGAGDELAGLVARFGPDALVPFTGPGFTPEFIAAPELASAELVHVASHGVVNLAQPEASMIRTSRARPGAPDHVTPADIRAIGLQARVVVLSACETAGSNAFRFDANLGFVSGFLGAGALSVMATLYPTPDRATARFMDQFYRGLAEGRPILAAFADAKRSQREHTPVGQWSAFQLFVR